MKCSVRPTLRLLLALTVALSIFNVSPAGEPLPGSVDLSFDPGSSINNLHSSAEVSAAVALPDGKWIIGGTFTTVHGATRGRVARLHADGTTDHSFMDGQAGANGDVRAIALQSDGKILIAGSFTRVNGWDRNRIARLNPDGSLDHGFGSYLSGIDGTVEAIAVQDDGRIVVGGRFTRVNDYPRDRLARLFPDGLTDHTFHSTWTGVNNTVSAIHLAAGGRILIGGAFTNVHGHVVGRIAQLFQDGTVDTGFGAGLAGANNVVESLAVQGDGRILIGGNFTSVHGVGRARIARLNADGTLDGSFGHDMPGADREVRSIAINPDGSILVGGSFNFVNGIARKRVARLQSNGALDQTFGSTTGGTFGWIRSLTALPDGRAIVAGAFTDYDGQVRHRIARLDSDGQVDATFNNVRTGPGREITALALHDGKVLIGGEFWQINGKQREGLARLNGDGTLDETFGDGLPGLLAADPPNLWSIARQSDGKFILGGNFTKIRGVNMVGIARIHPDGDFDDSFVQDPARNWYVSAVAVQPDDKILVGGWLSPFQATNRRGIARLHPDGALDETFSAGFAETDGSVMAILQVEDGKVLVAGSFTTINGVPRHNIARLHANGAVDQTFNPSAVPGMIARLARQKDGLILIGKRLGMIEEPPPTLVQRLHPNGELDSTFQADVTGGSYSQVSSLVVQNDGRILVAGGFSTVDGVARQRIARLNPDGSLDTDFAADQAGADAFVYAMALQEDGDILIAGEFVSVHGTPRHRIARLHGDDSAPPESGPQTIFLSRQTVANHTPAGTVIGSLSATGPGEGATYTFTLATGAGDVDNAAFTIEGDALQAAVSFDHEEKSSYLVRIRATDPEGLSAEQVFAITVAPHSAATEIFLSNNMFSETSPPGTSVGLLAVPDSDGPHTFRFAAGEGADGNALFALEDNVLKTAADFSYAEITEHTIRILALDTWDLAVETVFTILVEPNQAPTDILLSHDTIREGVSIETEVGRLSAIDPDEHDSHTFTLVAGEGDTGNASFTIDGDSLRSAAVFDRAVQDSYTIRVQATDTRGLSFARAFTITVTPPLKGSVDGRFAHGLSIDGAIRAVAQQRDEKWIVAGEFTTIDENSRSRIARLHPDGTLDHSFIEDGGGVDGTVYAVALQPDGGVVLAGDFTAAHDQPRSRIARLLPDGSLDTGFAPPLISEPILSVAVQRDGKILIGGSFTSIAGEERQRIARLHPDGRLDDTFAAGLAGANGTVRSVAVQLDGRILVGGDFTQFRGEDRARIVRLHQDGALDTSLARHQNWLLGPVEQVLPLPDGRILLAADYQEPFVYKLVALGTDGRLVGLWGDLYGPGKNLAMAVQPNGKILLGGSFTSLSNIPRSRFARLHPDGLVDRTFAEDVSGADDTVYAVATTRDGQMLIAGAFTTVNGEPRDRIALLHGDGPLENQAPFNIVLSDTAVLEEQPVGTVVGFLAAADPDPWDEHTFALVAGEGDEGNDLFSIENDELRTAAVLDFGDAYFHSIRIRTTDTEGLSFEKAISIEVLPDPYPRSIALSNDLVFENRPAGSLVGLLTATGRDPHDTYSFTLVEGEGDAGNAAFTIEDDELRTAIAFLRGEQSSYSVRVRATNTNGYFLDKVFIVHVEANQPPSDIHLSQTSISENAPVDATVGVLEAEDPDVWTSHTFTLVAGEGDDGNSAFAIDGNRLITAQNFTYATQNTYSIRVRATNSDELWLDKVFIISIQANQAPTGILLSNQRVAEGRPAGATVGKLSAIDPDAYDEHSFALVAGAGDEGNHSFFIDGSTVKTATVFDAVAQSSYSIRVRATDSHGLSVEQVFFIQIVPLPPPGQYPGELDISFHLASPGANDDVVAIARQSDGKILIGGWFDSFGGVARRGLARLNADGSLDTSFPDVGLAWAGASFATIVDAIVIQEDGKILIAGSFNRVHGEPRSGIARLNPDGSLDESFSYHGETKDGRILSLALQDDGRILVGGSFSQVQGIARNGIARLNTDGSVDPSFGHGLSGVGPGWSWINWWEIRGWVGSIAVLGDGRILIGGEFISINGVKRSRIARLHPDGSLDHTFGSTDDEIQRSINAMGIQSDGKIVIAGSFGDVHGVHRKGVARLNSDGSLDPDFAVLPNLDWAWLFALAVQEDDFILIGGRILDIDGNETHLARLNPDGTRDRGFAYEQEGPNDSVYTTLLDPAGSIFIGGRFTKVNGVFAHRVAKLHGGYAPPPNRAPGGIALSHRKIPTEQPEGASVGTFTAINPDPEAPTHTFTLVEGNGADHNALFFLDDNTLRTAVVFDHQPNATYQVRVRATNEAGLFVEEKFSLQTTPPPGSQWPGALDFSFFPGSSFDGPVHAIARQPDGKLIVAGMFSRIEGGAYTGVARLHPDGSPDHTFLADLPGPDGTVHAVTLQSDGKILIGGLFDTVHGQTRRSVARLHPDGSLDETFDVGIHGSNTRVRAIEVLADGRILIAGEFSQILGQTYPRIARLHPDGSVDTSFYAPVSNTIQALAVQADGKILISGPFTYIGESTRNRIARLHPNGAVDSSFGNGMAGLNVGAAILVPLPDGKIVIGGNFTTVNGINRLRIARLHGDGSLDTGFGTATSGANNFVLAAAVQDDGRVLIAGTFTAVGGQPKSCVALLNTDGSLDSGFSISITQTFDPVVNVLTLLEGGQIVLGGWFNTVNGIPRTSIARLGPDGSVDAGFENGPAGPSSDVYALLEDRDGKLIVGGRFASADDSARRGIVRLNPDGAADHSFGPDRLGLSHEGRIFAMARQPNGRILIAGKFESVDGLPRYHLARLYEDGTLDPTFTPVIGTSGWWGPEVRAIAIQEDGRILVAGEFTSVNQTTRNRIARLHTDGTLDTSFASGMTGAGGTVYSIALQPDGKIVVGGTFTTLNGEPRPRVARLNANGSIDTSFSTAAAANQVVLAVKLQTDGRILLGGGFWEVNGQPRSRIARLHADGTLDTAFFSGPSPWQDSATVETLELEADGRFLAGGRFTTTHGFGSIARFDTGGSLDTSFGAGLSGANWTVHAIASLAGNRIAVAGTFTEVNGIGIDRVAILYSNGSFPPDSKTYETWAAALPEGERASGDDPGGFGIPNLLRYAFGMDALQPDREKLPQVGQLTVTADGQPQTYLTLTYTRRTGDDSLIFIAEASDDLLSWSSFAGIEETADDGNGETETVTLTQSINNQHQSFLRVRVER